MADENQETFLRPTRRSYVYENSSNSGGKNRVILVIVGIIILVILVIVAIFASGKGSKLTQKITNKPTLALPSESPTKTPSPTPTPETLKRSDLSVEIQNGSGKSGVAGKAEDFLKGLGYNITSTGNADNFDYDKTVIKVKPEKKDYLDQLKQDLSKNYTVGSASADLSKGSADAVVIIGQE